MCWRGVIDDSTGARVSVPVFGIGDRHSIVAERRARRTLVRGRPVHAILIPAQIMFEVFVTIGVCVWTSAMVAESSNRAWAWLLGVGFAAFGIHRACALLFERVGPTIAADFGSILYIGLAMSGPIVVAIGAPILLPWILPNRPLMRRPLL
jgi:hypothetical protein